MSEEKKYTVRLPLMRDGKKYGPGGESNTISLDKEAAAEIGFKVLVDPDAPGTMTGDNAEELEALRKGVNMLKGKLEEVEKERDRLSEQVADLLKQRDELLAKEEKPKGDKKGK